jgi:hypothetical protein
MSDQKLHGLDEPGGRVVESPMRQGDAGEINDADGEVLLVRVDPRDR